MDILSILYWKWKRPKAVTVEKKRNIFSLLVLIKYHNNHRNIDSGEEEKEEEMAIVVRDSELHTQKLYSFDFFEQFNRMTSSFFHIFFSLNNGHWLQPLPIVSEWTNSFGTQKIPAERKKKFLFSSFHLHPINCLWVRVNVCVCVSVWYPKIKLYLKRSSWWAPIWWCGRIWWFD